MAPMIKLTLRKEHHTDTGRPPYPEPTHTYIDPHSIELIEPFYDADLLEGEKEWKINATLTKILFKSSSSVPIVVVEEVWQVLELRKWAQNPMFESMSIFELKDLPSFNAAASRGAAKSPTGAG